MPPLSKLCFINNKYPVYAGAVCLLDYNLYYACIQMHVDPFEEIEMAAKNAEEHRRSATEKDVRSIVIFLMSNLYALNLSYE